jgi:hypothetical protein
VRVIDIFETNLMIFFMMVMVSKEFRWDLILLLTSWIEWIENKLEETKCSNTK